MIYPPFNFSYPSISGGIPHQQYPTQQSLPMHYYSKEDLDTDKKRGERMRDNVKGSTDEELGAKINDIQNVLDTLEQESLTRHGWDAIDLMRSLCEGLVGQNMQD